MLVRLKELSVQKANGTYSSDDISNLKLEMTQLGSEIDNIFNNTQFNGKKVLTTAVSIAINDAASTLGISATSTSGITGLTSSSSLAAVDKAITNVNKARATYGSLQNRLESTVRNLKTTAENLQAAESVSETPTWQKKCQHSRRTIYWSRLVLLCWLRRISHLRMYCHC